MTGEREALGISARKHGAAQRAFFAVALPDALRASVAECAAVLAARPDGDGVRWVRPESYHLTLRFLGNVASEELPELVEAVRLGISGVAQCSVELGAPRGFPEGRRPRVVVLPVAPEEPLAELAERIEAAVVSCGLAPERHRFRAHLTLGRVRSSRLPALQNVPPPALAALSVQQVVLFRSDLARDGARYTPLQELSLASPSGTTQASPSGTTQASPSGAGAAQDRAGTTHSPSFNT